MNDYCYKLLCAINSYDGSAEKTNDIRKLICFISEEDSIEKSNDVKELLLEASEVIRVFGYNKLNNIDINSVLENNDYSSIKSKLIHDYYRAKSNDKAFLDKKQKEILDTFQRLDKRRIFVSAPTSFGKTHILKEIIYANSERYKKIVLIFPTIALLTENMDSISAFVTEHKLNYAVINSFQEDIADDRVIYILTPERAIMIFENQPKIDIDFFFFDEVYKIDEDFNTNDEYDEVTDAIPIENKGKSDILKYSRAVAFRLVLYFLAKYTPEFYLAGPYIDLSQVKHGMKRFIDEFQITCIQIDTEATLKTFYRAWHKNAESFNDIEGESRIQLDGAFSSKQDKIKSIYNYLNENNGGATLVYCNRPDYATRYAHYLANPNKTTNIQLREFISHLRHRYSVNMLDKRNGEKSTDRWSLIDHLEGEVGVHHGKLPKYIQKEMLRLFNDGVFSALFCTSTLIEGVNTKAKNIIVASSNIRANNKLNQFDIKNIIGRAGRYYHHFTGRVFFIEAEQEKILNGKPQKLNFPIFDAVNLSNEDIDNVAVVDLDENKREQKKSREKILDRDILPDEVFVKNRLFDRLKQEKLMRIILNKFAFFKKIFTSAFAVDLLTDEKISIFFQALCDADIISEQQKNGNFWIIKNYIYNGTIGLINYEMNYCDNFSSVDNGYSTAFNKVRTIIEYQMPQYITLFQALFNYACSVRNEINAQIDLTNLIRFFESGVESQACQYLAERGMPVAILRTIEKTNKHIKNMSVEEGQRYLSEHRESFVHLMDSYERRVFEKLII